MDLTSAIGSLGGDYVNKVTSAMKENASLSTSKKQKIQIQHLMLYMTQWQGC